MFRMFQPKFGVFRPLDRNSVWFDRALPKQTWSTQTRHVSNALDRIRGMFRHSNNMSYPNLNVKMIFACEFFLIRLKWLELFAILMPCRAELFLDYFSHFLDARLQFETKLLKTCWDFRKKFPCTKYLLNVLEVCFEFVLQTPVSNFFFGRELTCARIWKPKNKFGTSTQTTTRLWKT